VRRRTVLGLGVGWIGATMSRGTAASARSPGGPQVISTWKFGQRANRRALEVMAAGGRPLDAVEKGVMLVESDPDVRSVGYGGLPNRDGVVELDAAIQDGETLNAGSVAAIRETENPVAVARRVMEQTPHVLLVGAGATAFARTQGFPQKDLLTDEALARWAEWRKKKHPNPDDHDTIGLIAMDGRGAMAVACTTSGLAWKLPGRVGDSPLIGHGLYCDAAAGGAAATGVGEEVIRVAGSAMVVERMRQGDEPDEACRRVLRRIVSRPGYDDAFVGFIAMRADGLMR